MMNSKRSRTILWGSIIIAVAIVVCLILFLSGVSGKTNVYINEVMAENLSYPNADKQLCPCLNRGAYTQIGAKGKCK